MHHICTILVIHTTFFIILPYLEEGKVIDDVTQEDIVLFNVTKTIVRNISDVISHYEILRQEEFEHHVYGRCDVTIVNTCDRDVKFRSHNNIFNLKLVTSRDIVEPFELFVVSVDGRETESNVTINRETFYKGLSNFHCSGLFRPYYKDMGLIVIP